MLRDQSLAQRPTAVTEGSRATDLPPGMRVETCVCGGRIVAMENDEAIRLAVATHQATALHQAWWAQVWW